MRDSACLSKMTKMSKMSKMSKMTKIFWAIRPNGPGAINCTGSLP